MEQSDVLIAWAVVENKNRDSWLLFIGLVMQDLNIIEGARLTIITDQQKGMLPAIKELLPLVEHRCCARHIYSNFRNTNRDGNLKSLFCRVTKVGQRKSTRLF